MTRLTHLEQQLRQRIDARAQTWLDDACTAVAQDPTALRSRFPAVSRSIGRGPLDAQADPSDPFAWTLDDVARAVLLRCCGPAVTAEIADVYRFGDTAERRAVLRALDDVPVDDTTALALVEDAIRANDPRLIAAALGPRGVRALSDSALRQAVLKCVFVGLPISRVPGLAQRATPELATMLAEYVLERVAAGRSVPTDVWPIINRFPPRPVLDRIAAERAAPYEDRRAAAAAALSIMATTPPLDAAKELES